MKYVKIILGFVLLFSAGKEYANASKQLLDYFNPAIILSCLLIIFLSAWLIGSGFSKAKLKIISSAFFTCFAVSCLICFVIAFISLGSYRFQPEIISSNGIDVDIAEYMNGSKIIIPDKDERLKYCTCTINKMTEDKNLVSRYYNEFKTGKIDQVINSLKLENTINKYKLGECLALVTNFKWTPTFEQSIRGGILNQLSRSNISKTNDLNKYCDCLVEKYKKLPVKDFFSPSFYETISAISIDSTCNENSKLVK